MNDLISRQDAIDALERKKDKNAKGEIGGFYNAIIQQDIETVMELPSAQSEIITCKDCKWKNGTECMAFARVVPFPDDYCSRAVRAKE